MTAKDTSRRPQATGRTRDTEDTGDPGNLPDDVGVVLDDMDEVLEDNAEEIVQSYVQEGGQ